MNYLFKKVSVLALISTAIAFSSCKKDEAAPEEEHEQEVITDVTLTFTNTNDANDVVTARAQDPDGAGAQELAILDAINLDGGTTYSLTIDIYNKLETPGENIGLEVKEEGAEHQLFFGYTDGAFGNPAGNGNIDNSTDAIIYNDKDENNLNIGLNTNWETSSSALSDGKFRFVLQHQPDIKSATSSATDGDTDIDLEFVLNITSAS